jgi:hypothetical protein
MSFITRDCVHNHAEKAHVCRGFHEACSDSCLGCSPKRSEAESIPTESKKQTREKVAGLNTMVVNSKEKLFRGRGWF